jgi:hypothetical protein
MKWVIIICVVAVLAIIGSFLPDSPESHRTPGEMFQKIDMGVLEDELTSHYGETSCSRLSDYMFTCSTADGSQIDVKCTGDGTCAWSIRP